MENNYRRFNPDYRPGVKEDLEEPYGLSGLDVDELRAIICGFYSNKWPFKTITQVYGPGNMLEEVQARMKKYRLKDVEKDIEKATEPYKLENERLHAEIDRLKKQSQETDALTTLENFLKGRNNSENKSQDGTIKEYRVGWINNPDGTTRQRNFSLRLSTDDRRRETSALNGAKSAGRPLLANPSKQALYKRAQREKRRTA